MVSKFKSKYIALETDRKLLLNSIDGLDNNQLNLIINQGKWSITQVLYHIVKGEQYSIISLMNALKPDADLTKITFSAKAKSFLLNSALKTNFKFTAPPIAQKIPETVRTDELIKKWDDIRNELHNVCSNVPKEKYNKGVFKHPFIGMINLNQTLKFLLFHQRHHLKQIKELSKSLKNK